jgi:multidrug transporter EmrE-like cation transporter
MFMRVAVVELGAFATAGLRVSIASAFLLPLLLGRGHAGLLLKNWKLALVVGIFNSAIPFACFSYALLSISTGLSSILNATVPLFGAIIAWLWLKDRPDGSRILGLLIGFTGVALLAWDKASFKPDASGNTSGWAVLACLLATLCYGLSASFTKRYMAGLPSVVSATGSQMGGVRWPASAGLVVPAGPRGLAAGLGGGDRAGRAVLRGRLQPVFPPHRTCRSVTGAIGDVRHPGLCRALWRHPAGRSRNTLDAAVRPDHCGRNRPVNRTDHASSPLNHRQIGFLSTQATNVRTGAIGESHQHLAAA